MSRKERGFLLLLCLLLSLWCVTGCSVEELLAEIPGTMQIEQEEAEDIPTEERCRDREEEGILAGDEKEDKDETFLAVDASRFAYDSLSAEEQLWYQDMEQALGNMSEKKRLAEEGLEAGLDEKNIDKIFQCVLIDHPEIFYVDGYTYTKYNRGDKTIAIDFSGKYQLSLEEALQRKAEIEQAAEGIMDRINQQDSDYNKVKYVFETLIRETEYDLDAPDNQNIYSVLLGKASVCQGYAKATQYLLNRMGVECTLVQGRVENGEGHAWNLVRVDGSYYYVDTTWGDASYQREDGQEVDMEFLPEINYDYLCVTTQQLLRTHTLENIVPLPECIDTSANYYVQQGALFETYNKEQMQRLFSDILSGNAKDVTIKCADAQCYAVIKDALIEKQEIFDYLPEDKASVSYAHNEKQLSLTFWVTNQ